MHKTQLICDPHPFTASPLCPDGDAVQRLGAFKLAPYISFLNLVTIYTSDR